MSLSITIFCVVAAYFSTIIFNVARNRWRFRNLPTAGPYHPILGSLPAISEMKKNLPDDIHFHCWGIYLKEKYDLGKIAYFDPSPFAKPEVFIFDADLANQVTMTHSLPKSKTLKPYFTPITGPKGMITLEGPTWKKLRAMFNSGFSASHLATLVPLIIEETCIFTDILRDYAQKDTLFSMEKTATNLTLDVIAKVVLPTGFNCQTSDNEFISVFRAQSKDLMTIGGFNPFRNTSPFWKWRLARRTKQMNDYLGKILDDHYVMRKTKGLSQTRSKRIIDLALDLYEKEGSKHPTDEMKMDPDFREFAIDQIKTFVVAGHDTTSTTLCYIFYLVHSHPEVYQKLADELNTVLGSTTSESIEKIQADPHILNLLPYTNAVIKEALRLYPAASSRRNGLPGNHKIVDPVTKIEYPTFGLVVWPIPHTIQRSAEFFPEPHSFIPERWLPDSPHAPTHKDAWLPFSKGPRNCLGQELSMIESRVIIALTIREFDFVPEYPPIPEGADKKKYEFYGERAYPMLALTAKPKSGMPGRVRLRS